MPTAIPAMVASASGVSWTRSLPKRCCSPAVARNTPPLTPTSWPMTTTCRSCCISQPCAIAMASIMVIFAKVLRTAGLRGVFARDAPLLVQLRRQGGEQMIEHRIGRGRGPAQVFGDGRVDRRAAFFQQGRFPGRIPMPGMEQKFAHPDQRLEGPRILDFLRGAIAAGIVRGGVVAQPVGERLDHTGAGAAPRGLESFA